MRALVSSLLAKNLDRKELYGNRWCEYIALPTYFFIAQRVIIFYLNNLIYLNKNELS